MPGSDKRYTKLSDRFFSLSANNKNASESASPMAVGLAGKTCYLVEELPGTKLCTPLLKQMASQDDINVRGLFKNHFEVQLKGKLIINTNETPNLGEEGPCWDRAIFIPFNCRYVMNGDPVDVDNYRMPSDNAFVKKLLGMNDAFVTVCLRELHKFLNLPGNIDPETGECVVTELPQPKCVSELVQTEKSKAFPLKTFVETYVKESVHGNRVTLTVAQLFFGYRGYCRARNIRSSETQDDVAGKFPRVGLEIDVDNKSEQIVKGCYMTDTGLELAKREEGRLGGGDLLVSNYPIAQSLMGGQQKRPRDDEEEDAEKKHDDKHIRTSNCIITACEGPHFNEGPKLSSPAKRRAGVTLCQPFDHSIMEPATSTSSMFAGVQCQQCFVRSTKPTYYTSGTGWKCPYCNGRFYQE